MATTVKNFISTDSLQYEEHITTIQFQILQKIFLNMQHLKHILQTIFCTTQLFLTLGVTVPNTINTHKFCPSIIPGSKFKIPSQ